MTEAEWKARNLEAEWRYSYGQPDIYGRKTMSANNWRICPKCKAEALSKSHAASKSARDAYGKVPPEEYLKILSESKSESKLTETLREDWEILTDDKGTFKVSYGCSCETCGLQFSYNHAEKVII